MKEQAIQYLAMDVHQATVVACVRDERGTITMRATVPTEARAGLWLVRGAGPRVHVVFEEGTQAQWLHDLLQPHAERVVVCNVRGKSEACSLAKVCGRSPVPKPERRGGCRRGVAEPRLANGNRRDAVTLAMTQPARPH